MCRGWMPSMPFAATKQQVDMRSDGSRALAAAVAVGVDNNPLTASLAA